LEPSAATLYRYSHFWISIRGGRDHSLDDDDERCAVIFDVRLPDLLPTEHVVVVLSVREA
jgi:hypothetical protein